MSKIFQLRLDEEEWELLDQKCGQVGLDRAGFLKVLIRTGEICGRYYRDSDAGKGVTGRGGESDGWGLKIEPGPQEVVAKLKASIPGMMTADEMAGVEAVNMNTGKPAGEEVTKIGLRQVAELNKAIAEVRGKGPILTGWENLVWQYLDGLIPAKDVVYNLRNIAPGTLELLIREYCASREMDESLFVATEGSCGEILRQYAKNEMGWGEKIKEDPKPEVKIPEKNEPVFDVEPGEGVGEFKGSAFKKPKAEKTKRGTGFRKEEK
jgi:hypothetical protein